MIMKGYSTKKNDWQYNEQAQVLSIIFFGKTVIKLSKKVLYI